MLHIDSNTPTAPTSIATRLLAWPAVAAADIAATRAAMTAAAVPDSAQFLDIIHGSGGTTGCPPHSS